MPLLEATPGHAPGMVARFTRSVTAASAVVVALAGLFAGVGGTADACAATSAAAPAAGVTWHRLSLINNWESAGSSYGTGYPSWALKNGIVYLSGSVRQVSGNIVYLAQLPPGARPAHVVITPVYTYGGTIGWLEIYPGGEIYANSSVYTHAQDFTSLAGVSFPAASVKLSKLTLLNGWKRSTGSWDGAPAYTISGGMVYLAGALSQPSGSLVKFAVLPKAARPAHVEYITVSTHGSSGADTGVLRIAPGGVMSAYGIGAQARTWLGGVSFPQATTTSHKLALVNGWTSGQSRYSTGDPAYSVSNGVIHLSGSLIQPSPGSAVFATLPQGARPKHSLYIKVYTYSGSVGTLYIQPNGMMQAYSPSSSYATAYTSLAGISFPLGS